MPADALVLFGAMGDLAYKKIFPALYHMLQRGHLDLPAIGVARAGRTNEHLKERVRDGIQQQGGHNLASAQRLNAALHAVLPESRILRIDHYLGKEAVLNLLFFRFASGNSSTRSSRTPPIYFASGCISTLWRRGCITNDRRRCGGACFCLD
jgi:glucose-6-phosphate 1-dehydrogenase